MVKSKVWEHFSAAADNLSATCNFCNFKLNHKGSTTPLWNHYNSKHRLTESSPTCSQQSNREEDSNATQSELSQTSVATKRSRKNGSSFTRSISNNRAEEITQAMCKMIATDMQPTSIVEDAGFVAFMGVIEPGYSVPCRKTIDKRLHALFVEAKDKVHELLEKVDAVSLTTDAWTSRATDSYITVSAEFFDEDWKLRKVNLSTQGFSGSHTSGNLRKELQDVITDWKLEGKVSGISHDNASNITKAVEELSVLDGIQSERCAAHTIQLAVNSGLELEECADVVTKASNIVGAFRHSYVRMGALETKLKALELPTLRLVQRCATRWDSTYYMLKRLCELRSGITATLADRNVFKSTAAAKLDMCEADWVAMDNLTTALEPLQQATTVLCSDKHVTLSLVRPIVHSLISRHLKTKTETSMITAFKEEVSEQLIERFGMHGTRLEINLQQISCFLDPRHKFLCAESSATVRDKIHQEVKKRVEQQHNTGTEGRSTSTVSKTVLDLLLGENEDDGENEFTKYLAEPQIDRNLDPSTWWKEHERCYPALSKLANQILCIPATSASAERDFSCAGSIVSAKRSRLLPENVNKLIFLHQNKKNILFTES